jgi:predicted anti-sigma-YlaC factor YlaD
MNSEKHNSIHCTQFEELLTDYLDKTLSGETQKGVAAHALMCPLCHSLLNEVKEALAVCREIAEPAVPMTRLEARILEKTVPRSVMHCEEFEDHLTDYLDGFLPAQVFHRWERHAVLCDECTDLPGTVVRSLAACVTYKLEELPLPAGLHEAILQKTVGTEKLVSVKASKSLAIVEWMRNLRFPISMPQLAPVAMMLVLAFLVFSQTVSADGSLAGVYTTGFELAEQTYKQGADAWSGNAGGKPAAGEPMSGGTYVDSEGKR